MVGLEDKLYTSSEVTRILNVTLRTLYRYLDRGYIVPDVQLLSGRYRFSKKNIEDLLSKRQEKPLPRVVKEAQVEKEKQMLPVEAMVEEDSAMPPIENKRSFFQSGQSFQPVASEVSEEAPEEDNFLYFKSPFGSLKTIAKIINQTSQARGVPYAFTREGGLSLFQEVPPFSTVFAYVLDESPFVAALQAEKAFEGEATVCFVKTIDSVVFDTAIEEKGLVVVSKDRLKSDLEKIGKGMLAQGLQRL